MDGALPLILFWHLGAKELGSITKEEWTKGMESSKLVHPRLYCVHYSPVVQDILSSGTVDLFE